MLKNIIRFSILAFLSTQVAYAGMHDVEHARKAQKLKARLDLGTHVFEEGDEAFVKELKEFEDLTQYFPGDHNLRFAHAAHILDNEFTNSEPYLKGLQILASCILDGADHAIIWDEFMKALSERYVRTKPLVEDIALIEHEPDKYMKREQNRIQARNANELNAVLSSEALKKHEALFTILKQTEPILYEATLISLYSSRIYTQLLERLYERGDGEFSPFLLSQYAHECLLGRGKHKEALAILEKIPGSELELDPENIYQTPKRYSSLSVIYHQLGKPKMALRYLENEITLRRSPRLGALWNSVAMNLLMNTPKSLNEAEASLSTLRSFPAEIREEAGYSQSRLDRAQVLVYQKLGKNDEVLELLTMRQRTALEQRLKKRSNRATIIRDGLEALQIQQEIKTSSKKGPTPQKPKRSALPTQRAEQTLSQDMHTVPSEPEDSFDTTKPPKKKVKTRGTPDPAKIDSKAIEAPSEQKPLVKIEDLLKKGSQPYQTFYKLFQAEEEKLRARQVKISMDEISSLMAALGQDFDKKKGKGSHTKVTMNFSDRGVAEDEKMIILSKKTYLLPYQIEQLRETFRAFGFYPGRD